MNVRSLHHISLVASDAQRTVGFYTRTLGLRLVKKTVNFDDPGVYHLYFGDAAGTPGSAVTFFIIPGARQGAAGTSPSPSRTRRHSSPAGSAC